MCREFPLLPESAADTQSEPQQAIPAGPERPTILNFTPPHCVEKSRLRLPESQEEWEETNTYFSQVLVPQVISQVSPDSKNSVLSEGVYTFFSSKYGTIQPSKKNRRQEKCAQALNRAKRMKNEARRELRQAKASGSLLPDEVMSLARKFYQLVRAHSKCKRTFNRAHASGKAR